MKEVIVRLTDEEEKILTVVCKVMGYEPSDYVRRLIQADLDEMDVKPEWDEYEEDMLFLHSR